MAEKIRILFLAADPSDLTRTRLAGEYQVIREELERGKSAHRFLLEPVFSAQIPDMTRAVKNFRPHIIHFSGHGSIDGELSFEDPEAKAKRVKPKDLEGIFSRLARKVDCVVLNACYSGKQAAVISKHIPYVVGVKGVIQEQAAIWLAQGFYQSLAAGESLKDAFKDGCALLRAQVSSRPQNALSSVKPVLKVGLGAARPLEGPWGVVSKPPGLDVSESRNKCKAKSAAAQGRARATVTGLNIRARGKIKMTAAPGTVHADGLEADHDVTLEGSTIKRS